MEAHISQSLNCINEKIKHAARSVGREGREIRLIGVSKTRTPDEILSAYRCGLVDFGENRVQEALEKIPLVEQSIGRDSPKIRWHLIGHLQSNKVNRAVEIFDVIHSIDSIGLAQKVGASAKNIGKNIECLVQVNTSGEISKSGTNADGALDVAEAVAGLPNLTLTGLMTIGPQSENRQTTGMCFDELRTIRDRFVELHPEWKPLGLSMGMSGDYELAITYGATMIRVGTALFGSRSITLT